MLSCASSVVGGDSCVGWGEGCVIRSMKNKNILTLFVYIIPILSIQARRDSDSLDHHSIVSFLDLCAKVVTLPTTTVSFLFKLFIDLVLSWGLNLM